MRNGSGFNIDSSSRSKVLIVEDDSIVVELLFEVLKNAGFDVFVAGDAIEGLKLYHLHHSSLLCVLLDYDVPGMHASRLLESFREIDSEVNVILSSGYPLNFIGKDFPVEEVFDFMPKPYDPQLLVKALNRL